jgi:hypothetical protein
MLVSMRIAGQLIVLCSVGALLGGLALVLTASTHGARRPLNPPRSEVRRSFAGPIISGIVLMTMGGLGLFLAAAGHGLGELANH